MTKGQFYYIFCEIVNYLSSILVKSWMTVCSYCSLFQISGPLAIMEVKEMAAAMTHFAFAFL